MTRRRFTERQTLECAILQGAVIPCFRCKALFTVETIRSAEREHIHEVVLGGPDTVEACAYSHGDCHSVVTNGTPATSAGSSKHKAAKIRPGRTEKFVVNKPPTGTARQERPTKPWASRKIPARANPWPPKGLRKLQSRPFGGPAAKR